ncbi:nucleotidyltransferase domain-containing protein [bacterium]|nr:nucleotidyltransferase domain-containing protein [bacterium]
MSVLDRPEYEFLRNMNDLILLGYGGSHAYGTNIATSDIDIRGIYMNPIDEILGNKEDSEQRTHSVTDTTVYSFKKMIKLLCECNPNTIEILGLRPKDYLYMTNAGKLLLDNSDAFLSQRAIYTFGKYAESQLNRLVNKSGRGKAELTKNEIRSLRKALSSFELRHAKYAETKSDISVHEIDGEILFNMKLNDIPINVLIAMLNEINSINKDYCKSSRNEKAIQHDKLNKHMMHLLRLYIMGIDILQDGKIVTYREKEHDVLMDIRACKYLESDMMTPTKEFEELILYYKNEFEKAAQTTNLPPKVDAERINKLTIEINTMALNGAIKKI